MPIIYLGIGANLGDREANLKKALELLLQIGKILNASKLYETEPHGVRNHPPYLNQCVMLETNNSPETVFNACSDIEKKLGRVREKGMMLPRTIDIDLLFYDNLILESNDLLIPHPRLHERKFVLVPLAEIASDFIHPTFKKTISELLKECEDQGMVQQAERSEAYTTKNRV